MDCHSTEFSGRHDVKRNGVAVFLYFSTTLCTGYTFRHFDISTSGDNELQRRVQDFLLSWTVICNRACDFDSGGKIQYWLLIHVS